MTRLYGVIGDPITHSLSPLIHRGWIRDLGLDADYRGFHVPDGELDAGLAALEREGVRGLNVTLPHKSAAMELCAQRSFLVERVGAANTLSRLPDGGWRADNTDKDGFLEDFTPLYGERLAGARVLLLGAGGAARAVALALMEVGVQPVIANRTKARALALCADLDLPAKRAIALEEAGPAMEFADGVINCLSLGHAGGELELTEGNGRLFYDISYGKAAARILERASAQGWKVSDGLGMLVGQAALSFQIWHGILPEKATAIARCRTALEAVS
ncbi:MAG: shikimate dehydrogenase [Hyphomonadaceae bacterium]|nr:shikimate dehydrogenase [Hyphomonadaceae bacterium]